VPANERDGVLLRGHREWSERRSAAETCVGSLGLTAPLLIDGMENAADRAYGAWPERLYVIDREGRIAYQGGKGPYGFDPEELERFLNDALSR
jgi:type I thyroxine 5'-deiodinase